MQVLENTKLAQDLLKELMDEIDEDRSAMHPSVTDLIYCLTKSWYKANGQALEETDKTKLYFVIGLGLERALLVARKVKPVYGEFEGVHYHLDSIDQGLLELKSTRAWPAKEGEEPKFSDSWIRQTQAYCKANGILQCDIAVIYIGKPDFRAYNVTYTQAEVDKNWDWIIKRKAIWESAMATMTVPKAYSTNEDWECKECTYKMVCDVKKRLGL